MHDAIESLLAKIRFEFCGHPPSLRRDWVFDVNESLKSGAAEGAAPRRRISPLAG
jgi:hypothetical protein